MVKRLFDLIVAAVGLLVASPVLLVSALLIRRDSPGPAFYAGERVGKDGVPFKMYKLRTMVVDADRQGSLLTQGGDPRVTAVGRVLRKWKLDELPQLINVLRGEMSLVGPRPESPCYVRFYTPEQRRVLAVRPGITGPTQVRYRHEETLLQGCKDMEREYVENIMPRKLSVDLAYVESHSLLGDARLLVQTFASLFKRAEAGAAHLPRSAAEGDLPRSPSSGGRAAEGAAGCQIGTFQAISEGPAPAPPAGPARRLKLFVRRRLSPAAERRFKGYTNDLANRVAPVLGRETRPAEPIARLAVPLQAGDRVRVRPQAEIEATLNNWRQLRGCSFMPEMAQYCGTDQRVLKRLERFVDERDLRVKRSKGIVFLEDVHCRGTADFGRCDRSCFLFWREEWLERITE